DRLRAARRDADRDRAGTHGRTDRSSMPAGSTLPDRSRCHSRCRGFPKPPSRRTHCGILQTSRGLSPLAFCDLNGSIIFFAGRALQMTAPQNATASTALDPALLRIDGSLATITLNRPAAFNAIDLAIAKRLEE